MNIVIDGYNMLGSRGGLGGDVTARREAFIAELSSYARAKGHVVTVVFDGQDLGLSDRPSLMGVVRVVFSRGERADDVVIRLSASLGSGGTIVSSDREVRDKCRPHGGVVLTVTEFDQRLRQAVGDEAPTDFADKDASDEEGPVSGPKRGNPFRLSKAERKKRKRLGRL